jgi:hypothetical protein
LVPHSDYAPTDKVTFPSSLLLTLLSASSRESFQNYKFKNILKNNVVVVNDVFHRRANYQCKIFLYFVVHKNDKSVNLSIVNSAHFKLYNLSDFSHFCDA